MLVKVIGFDQLTATGTATAVTGLLESVSGAVLPVTFPRVAVTCGGVQRQVQIGSTDWPMVDPATANSGNESTIPLCSDDTPGSVGWLDFANDFGDNCGNRPKRSPIRAE